LRSLGAGHPITIEAGAGLGEILRTPRCLDAARALQEDLLQTVAQALRADDLRALTIKNNLASTLENQGGLERARRLREEVLEGRRRQLGDDHPLTISAMNNLAARLRDQGELERARELGEETGEETLAARRRVLGPSDPATFTAMSNSNLAGTVAELGELARGRALAEAVLAHWLP
jgi:tetratricopeptide (TPR) repeat protein